MLLVWSDFRKTGSKAKYLLAVILACFSFFSYEGSIIILPLLILWDIFICKEKILKDKILLSYIPFAIFTVSYPFVRLATHAVNFNGDYSYNLLHLVPNFAGNFFGYFGLFIFGESFIRYYLLLRDILREQSFYIAVFLIVVLVVFIVLLILNKHKIRKIYQDQDLRLMVFSILFSFVALIPFLGLGNLAERYSYLSAFGFTLLLIVLIKKLVTFGKTKNIKVAILLLLTLIIGIFYYYQQTLENAQWKEAGRITKRTLSYLRIYYDGNHPKSNFYFVNVPIRREQAWIFPVGLDDGVWFIYRDSSIRVYKTQSLEEGKKLAKIKNNFVFAFDKNNNIYAVK
jgi:hypothetical protein